MYVVMTIYSAISTLATGGTRVVLHGQLVDGPLILLGLIKMPASLYNLCINAYDSRRLHQRQLWEIYM